jgi:hypothetical protein
MHSATKVTIPASKATDAGAIFEALSQLKDQGAELRSVSVKIASTSIKDISATLAITSKVIESLVPGNLHTFLCILCRLPAEKVIFEDSGGFF